MKRLRATPTHPGDDRGAVLVIVVIWMWLALLPMFVVFVVDVGNWFVHKRHLQLQADAGALAGGGLFTFPCSDVPIVAEARKYAGDPSSAAPYNLQVAPTDQANVHVLVNSSLYWNEGGTDYSDGGPPCSTSFIDVKITESTLPWFFGLGVVPAINSHARVEIQALHRAFGALPVAVPDVDPAVGRAYFIDEANGGAVIASVPLTKTGSSNGMAIWDNVAAPVSVPINSSRIGVRIALGGGTSTTCGQELVECYDMGSSNGILFVRGWSASGSGAPPNAPIARSVTLFPGSCSDPYFVSSSTACSVGVAATVDFGPTPVTQVKVSAVVAGVERQLQYDATSGRWISTSGASSFFTVNPSAGPLPVELKWEVNAPVAIGGNNCTTTGGNKCKGTFGTVQRVFSALPDRSGPIKLAQVWEGGSGGANSFQTGTTHDLVVKIAIQGNLAEAQSVSDPIVLLRVTGGSQNQSLDCDPDWPNLRDEIANGCRPAYEINTGDPCPATYPDLQATAQPWDCVAVQTGGAVGQLEQGMKQRILGGASTCTSPNNWSSFPNIPAEDPRIVPVFVTPFGTFTGSGNDVVPVTKFATFYVTGWFSSPCSGDDPVPDKGYVVGHFIKYVYVLNNGGGSGELCDFNAFGSCIAVLTE